MVFLGIVEIIRSDDENSGRENTRVACCLQRSSILKEDSTDDRDKTGDRLFKDLEV